MHTWEMGVIWYLFCTFVMNWGLVDKCLLPGFTGKVTFTKNLPCQVSGKSMLAPCKLKNFQFNNDNDRVDEEPRIFGIPEIFNRQEAHERYSTEFPSFPIW